MIQHLRISVVIWRHYKNLWYILVIVINDDNFHGEKFISTSDSVLGHKSSAWQKFLKNHVQGFYIQNLYQTILKILEILPQTYIIYIWKNSNILTYWFIEL